MLRLVREAGGEATFQEDPRYSSRLTECGFVGSESVEDGNVLWGGGGNQCVHARMCTCDVCPPPVPAFARILSHCRHVPMSFPAWLTSILPLWLSLMSPAQQAAGILDAGL